MLQPEMATTIPSGLRALAFDVFGTLVDVRGSLARDLSLFGLNEGLTRDWSALADAWYRRYAESVAEIRTGDKPWKLVDQLNRDNLDALLDQFDLTGVSMSQRD